MSGTTEGGSGDFTAPGKQNGVTDLINNSSNTGKEVTQTIASELLTRGVEYAAKTAGGLGTGAKVLGTGAGALVQPAVWVLSGKPVQPGDGLLWGMGVVAGVVAGTLGGVASATTGIVKALVEDDEDNIIASMVIKEPEKYRPFITSVRNYGMSGRGIVAMTIANHGGVAWRVGPSTWVYIKDALGRLVCDYQPANAYSINAPDLPLRIAGRDSDGLTYRWSQRPGNLID